MQSSRLMLISVLVTIFGVTTSSAAEKDPFLPFFDQPQALAAIQAFNAGKPAFAARLARTALESGELDETERSGVSFLLVLSLLRSGQRSAALQAFNDLSEDQLPPGLASHVAWYHGKLLLDLARPGKPDIAKAHSLLSRVPLSGRFGYKARQLLVRGLILSGEVEESCRLVAQTADRLIGKRQEAAARLQQARCIEQLAIKTGQADGWKKARPLRRQAAAIYRLVARLWPGLPAGQAAAERLKRLSAKKIWPSALDPQALLKRARQVVNKPRGRKDLKTLMRIRSLAPKKLKDPVRCEIDLLYAEVAVRFRWFKTAYRLLNGVKKRAADPELRARAAVDLAGLVARRRPGAAVEAYFDVVKTWPKSKAAAWALYRAGVLGRHIGMPAISLRALYKCIEKYPDSPAAARSRFALAWVQIEKKKYAQAKNWLNFLLASADTTDQASLDSTPPEICVAEDNQSDQLEDEEASQLIDQQISESSTTVPQTEEQEENISEDQVTLSSKSILEQRYFRERVRYWRARVHEISGAKKAALADYDRLIKQHPFGYYALMAAARVSKLDPEYEYYPKPDSAKKTDDLPDVASLHPEVSASVTYLRMGLLFEARATLATLHRDNLERIDRRMAASLWLLLGEYSRSLWIAPIPWEGGVPGYPSRESIVDARLAYPRAFYDIVKSPARDPKVPPAFLFALMRAESAFRPKARSPARALGLTQVVRRTAYRTARKLRLKNFRFWKLTLPEVSIRVG
ncbi:MAG: transglycosylase SLT domain-containing protein, partial [Deltaproteobacteria bacterium]|nr:transglycosylase SLT domain-containing protein [Deltaproteobacteria bacterium]